jgi:hypothetical protein
VERRSRDFISNPDPAGLAISTNTIGVVSLHRFRLLSDPMRRCVFVLLLPMFVVTYIHSETPWFSVGVDSKLDSTFTKDPRFPVKPQSDVSIAASLELLPLELLGLGASLGYHWTKDSNLQGGFLYRAYSGADLRLFFSSRFLTLLKSEAIVLVMGSNQGALMRLDRYELTTLYFFYWGLFIHPFLELGFRRFPLLSVQLALPFDYYFRKELDLSTSIGLGLNLKLYPLRKQWD